MILMMIYVCDCENDYDDEDEEIHTQQTHGQGLTPYSVCVVYKYI